MKNGPILLLTLLLFSCHTTVNKKWLDMARKYEYIKPDSCLYFLKKINDPSTLKPYDRACYQLLLASSTMSRWNVTIEEKELLDVIPLFIEAGDTSSIVKIYYRLGGYTLYYGRFDEAYEYYQHGLAYVTDPETRAKFYQQISHVKLFQGLPEEALSVRLNFLKDTADLSDYQKTVMLGDLGEVYVHTGKPDSAHYYYDIAIRKAGQYEYTNLLSHYHRKKSELYKENGEIKKAFEELALSKQYDKGPKGTPLNLFSKARIFLAAGELDSAKVYFHKTVQTPNTYLAARAYEYMAYIHQHAGEDSLAIVMMDLYNDQFHHLNSHFEQSKDRFQDDQLKFENSELKLKQKQQDIYLLSLGLVLLFICSFGYIIYIREKRKKQIKEQTLKEELLKNQVKQLEQENQIISLTQRTTALREQLFRRLSASHKIPSLAGEEKSEKQELRSRLTTEELEELVDMVNKIWPGFAERLQKTYPLLRPKDIGFCCLIKCGITTKDLASIYYVTPSAISQKKARMKKEKFDLTDKGNCTLDEIVNGF